MPELDPGVGHRTRELQGVVAEVQEKRPHEVLVGDGGQARRDVPFDAVGARGARERVDGLADDDGEVERSERPRRAADSRGHSQVLRELVEALRVERDASEERLRLGAEALSVVQGQQVAEAWIVRSRVRRSRETADAEDSSSRLTA